MVNERADKFSIKKNNQTLILQTVFNYGVMSRTEIAKVLSMSKPAVNEHIDQLLANGIIREIGAGTAARSGGRRPILIETNPSYKVNIALDLNYTKPLVALGTITGNPIDKMFLETLEDFGSYETDVFDDLKSLIKKAIDRLMIKNKVDQKDIGIAVISTPGIINEKTQEIHINSQFKSRYAIELKNFLKNVYDVEVLIKNDVNMAAVAEAKFLKNENIDNLLFLSCGLGLGSAIVLNGKLYEGFQNAAGEIGYYIEDGDFTPLDERICIRTLIRNIKQGIKDGEKTTIRNYNEVRFDKVVEAYVAGDEFIISEIRKISSIIGIAINNSASLIDVSTVVIGGDYLVFKDVLFEEVNRIMEKSFMPVKPNVIPTSLHYAGGIIGCFDVAATYIIENLEL